MISSFVNSYFTYRLLKIVAQPWKSTPAFINGVLDQYGNRLENPDPRAVAKYYTPFDRIAYNIKRTISNVPGSQNPLARWATAIALMREGALMESDVNEVVDEIDPWTPDTFEEDAPVNNVGDGNVKMQPVPLLRKRKKLGEELNFFK